MPACVAGEEQQRQKRPHVLDGVGVELPVDLEDMVVKQSEKRVDQQGEHPHVQHDHNEMCIRDSLAAIRLRTDSILQTENSDRETAREFVTDIGQEAERLSRITEDLLRLTRLDSNVLERPVVVDALPVLEQVCLLYKSRCV